MKNRIPSPPPQDDTPFLIERPDGFYWQDPESKKTFGPFPSLLAAQEDMDYQIDSDYEEGESLEEAENELGISGWIDPDTGDLAEDMTPHLNGD
jgi:hypothetical protein